MIKATFLGVAVAVAALAALLGAASAPAKGGGDAVIKNGSCSGAATWKLKAKHDNAAIETEFEVDQNRVGKRWKVVIRQNGVKRFEGIRTTKPPSGSFTVHRLLDDKAGSDKVVAKARALATGQTCRGALTI
jgi:hypothetical protein